MTDGTEVGVDFGADFRSQLSTPISDCVPSALRTKAYPFNMHYYFIARCTLIPQIAASMLSRVTLALLRLLARVYQTLC